MQVTIMVMLVVVRIGDIVAWICISRDEVTISMG